MLKLVSLLTNNCFAFNLCGICGMRVWYHKVPEYHTNSNKDLLLDVLVKELNDKFTSERKWKWSVKTFRCEHAKATYKPSGSGTSDIYQPTLYSSLLFIDVICDDTDDTVDTIDGPT